MKPVSPRRSAIVAALDIGTSKIVCLIARLKPQSPQEALRRRSHGVEILGIGHTEARGMKGGAVDQSRRGRSGGAPRRRPRRARRFGAARIRRGFGVVRPDRQRALYRDHQRRRLRHHRRRHRQRADRGQLSFGAATAALLLHSLPIGYSLDGVRGIGEPRGMLAREFGVDMHAVTCDIAAARNLMLAVERCHLSVETMVAAPYVAGLSAMADDEADLGAALVDMGAGTTTDGGVLQRPLHPRRQLRAGRPARHHGSGARAERTDLRRRAHQDAATAA